MKTLVFSDAHLGASFEKKKYDFLVELISQFDRVIINGDFWDGHLTTIDRLALSPWKKLFPLLKKKKTVYIYGNHDKKAFSNNKVSLFSVRQELRFELKEKNQTYVFEHGNRLLPSFDEKLNLSRKMLGILTTKLTRLERILTRLAHNTSRPWGIILNAVLKRSMKQNSHFYVFGHTHFAEFDPKNRFADSGFIQHGLAQYLTIENGEITPHQQWYE